MKRLLRSTTILLVALHRLLITNSVVCVCVSLHIQQHDATSGAEHEWGEEMIAAEFCKASSHFLSVEFAEVKTVNRDSKTGTFLRSF